eukprot:Hpha_TRINITY_DN15343_c2_g11::TRINITY_DN15343_c2_g11_i1::g.88349::m.88349
MAVLAMLMVGAAAHSMLGAKERAQAMLNGKVQQGRARAVAEAARVGRVLASPTPPTFPRVWGSKRQLIVEQNGTAFNFMPPSWFVEEIYSQDADKQRGVDVTVFKSDMVPKSYVGTSLEFINLTQYQVGDSFQGMGINGVTLQIQPVTNPWQDQFGWVKYASHAGQKTEGGRTIDIWQFNTTGTNLTLESDHATGLPVREVVLTINDGTSSNYTYIMSDFKADEDYGLWKGFNETEFTTPAVCGDSDPAPVNKTMYIFHPVNKFNISDQDLGDIVGDTFFVCLTYRMPGMPADHDYQWITQWEIELIPRWGQYLNCNDYPAHCLGNGNWYVGHEAAEAIGSGEGGQCSENPLIGEWWSLPEGGRCAEGKRPGDGSCTWRIVQRTKTIDSTCLFKDQGYGEACKADMRAPFPKAAATFVNAFKSDNKAAGGCPPINV